MSFQVWPDRVSQTPTWLILRTEMPAGEKKHVAERHLETVHSQAPPGLIIAVLQIADYAVVHILLLLAQEVRRHSVQAVAGQLMVSLERHQQVKLYPAVDGNLLVLSGAIGLAAELRIPHLEPAAQQHQNY